MKSEATSNGSPTKSVGDCNINNLESDEKQNLCQHQKEINVNKFELLNLKFDSILVVSFSGLMKCANISDEFFFLQTDSLPGNSGAQTGSRFSKWFHCGTNNYNQSSGSNFFQAFLSNNALCNKRFPQQNQKRHSGQLFATYGSPGVHPSEFYDPQQQGHVGDYFNTAFKRLVDMVAKNRANNILTQQQYLMQLLNKNQQSAILRRMVMNNPAGAAVLHLYAAVRIGHRTGHQQQQQHRPLKNAIIWN